MRHVDVLVCKQLVLSTYATLLRVCSFVADRPILDRAA